MPIRFRCQHCSQLMGIARRKAGTTVPCTRCGKSVLVPASELVDAPPPPRVPPVPVPARPVPARPVPERPAPRRDVPLLERSDFDEQVEEANEPQPYPEPGSGAQMSVLGARQPPPVAPPGEPGEPVEYDVEPIDPRRVSPAGGFILTSFQATLLTLAAILALVLAFGAGLLVGKYFL